MGSGIDCREIEIKQQGITGILGSRGIPVLPD